MVPIVESIEIARSPADVFAYLDQLDRHGEWQDAIVSSTTLTQGPVRVGTRATDKRRVPGGMKVDATYEILEYDPPRRTRFQVVNGPVRPVGTVTVEALDGGTRSRLTIELDFQGHGIGKLLAPIARRQAMKQVPGDQLRLKQRLEAGA
jgi:uncharacterized protein YndB with AHSA1/START domain